MNTKGSRPSEWTFELKPRARTDGLVVKELAHELLIYDLTRHKAHCLNETSALVWRECDGESSVVELTRKLERNLATPLDDDVVLLALNQLRRFHLLEPERSLPAAMGVSRRDLVRKYLPAALVLPLILSIPSPASAQAASIPCATLGEVCDQVPCCPGLTCDGTCFPD